MEIKIKGSEDKIKKFLKVNSLFMKRNKIGVVSDEKEEKPKTAANIAELITKIENLEDLKQYSEDKRQVVELAYKKKLKELE